VFFLISLTFVWRSFYAMRIKKQAEAVEAGAKPARRKAAK
jgi:hypothetical protein